MVANSSDKPHRVAPLRLCTTITEEGEKLQPFIHCPDSGKTIDALQCAGCARMRSIEWTPNVGGAISCEANEAPSLVAIDPRADLGEAAARVLVRDVVGSVTTCIAPNLSIPTVKHLLKERGLRSVAVVDDNGKLQGLISRTDVTRAPDFGCAADMMPPHVHALPENAPIGHAIALMGFENLSEVPVVTDDGKVIGIFQAVDALRWVAERMGYLYSSPLSPSSPSSPSSSSSARELLAKHK
jgi:CBS domain-containing protein